MEKQTVIVNVVGIRHNLPNGEADYQELFDRCPVDSMVYLRVVPEGEKYKGAVEVLDGGMQKIGNLSKTEKRLIILEIPKPAILPIKVHSLCPKHNCIKVIAENTKGFDEPHIGQIEKENGETVFPVADIDTRRQRREGQMRALIGKLKANAELTEADLEELTEATLKYTPLCCTSIDGETQFTRAEILMYIDTIRVRYDYAPLTDAYWEAYELHKDQSKKEDQTRIFREQFDRMRQYAQAHAEGKDCSPLEEYRDTLAFVNGGKLTREILEAEHIRLANLLSDTLDGKYVECVKKDKEFASNIYMLNYDLYSLYTLFTRRLKHEYIGQLLEEYEPHEAFTGTAPAEVATHAPAEERKLCIALNREQREMLARAEKEGIIQYNKESKGYDIGKQSSNVLVAYLCGRLFCNDSTDEHGAWIAGLRFDNAKYCQELFGFDVSASRRSAQGTGSGNSPKGHERVDKLFED